MRKILTIPFISVAVLAFGQTDNENKLKDTWLFFPNFTVIVNDFDAYPDSEYEYGLRDLELDSKQNNSEAIIQNDTIYLSEDVDNSIGDKTIKIAPKNKTDIFKISFLYKQELLEVFDHRNGRVPNEGWKEWKKNAIYWTNMTRYEKINSSSSYLFKIPEFKDKGYRNELKIKYSLRDTLVNIPAEYTKQAQFVYKNRLLEYTIEYICLRIDRYSNNKLMETKYIIVAFNYYC